MHMLHKYMLIIDILVKICYRQSVKYYLRENQWFNCYDSNGLLVEYVDWYEREYKENLKHYEEETIENHIEDSGIIQMVEIPESIYLKVKALYGS